ncbi:small ribosomal subunit protein mS38 [Microcaecilia unicolor]|uniref:Small ribosomal subunit protein mS38 n=1 Tax=Microcaecilia unicolor TaxID=1415580 RepID=A0A6P7WNJ6_9AMPH|nr:aurora kinase A-interacting protein [Microcaecilia unicolor]XP_030041938.1 aurora kinase A-interacting protein [Microcaecilia unicolor]XP_030041939.1 aurora kinase A-interacting protein [Microcaecilia unicolor]XP_030041940.1 aurora kinase A-interacting protein [Microcaecilia unicolor]XP_030041941.1 aurora kinase A-interacting protein [Microcaecilia unicolor]XP_030041942.1 aurora kinase A-interacting protein [Microcaecilia unicolor]XP_030041943.1 aurora kinase A-interacting protein [Microca
MWLTRVMSQVAKTTRLAGSLSGSVHASVCPGLKYVNYSTQHSKSTGTPPQRWYALDSELEEMLVPRRMSISPLESWLTVRYSLPRAEVFNIVEKISYAPGGAASQYNCPQQDLGEIRGERDHNGVQCKNVLKIRRRKMNRHQYRKRQKRTKFLRRKILEGRRKKRQKKFEMDLKRIWKKAGLKNPPAGWEAPKIFLRQGKSE